MNSHRPHVVILGAGPAGLGAAFQLTIRNRARVTVLERSERAGGNAGSFEVDGLFLDYGSHRLHPSCDPSILSDLKSLLGDDLLLRPRHGRIRINDRWIHFPIKPANILLKANPLFSLGIFRDMVLKPFGKSGENEGDTFASILEAQLGKTICNEFYFPYARKIWGLSPENISGVQARRRVSMNSFGKIFKKMISTTLHNDHYYGQQFYYPRKGYGQISDAIYSAAVKHGCEFGFGANVTDVHLENNRAVTVAYEGDSTRKTISADHVWSTIPISILIQSVKPAPADEILSSALNIKYRAMILVYIFIEQDRFSEFDAHYFPGADIRITRLSEPKNYSNAAEPSGLTALCAELPCDISDEVWGMKESDLCKLVLNSLESANIPLRSSIRRFLVRRIEHAYPIYERGFEDHFNNMYDYIDQIDNVLTFGRQGLFVHDNTHHALYMAYAAVDCLDEYDQFDRDKWRDYRKVFENHVVED